MFGREWSVCVTAGSDIGKNGAEDVEYDSIDGGGWLRRARGEICELLDSEEVESRGHSFRAVKKVAI